MGRMEFLFLGLFWAAFLALIAYISALLILGKPPLSGVILPDRAIEDWDDFRSLTFGVAGVVGAVFGLFQLYNAAYRSRLTKEDVAEKARDVEVKLEAERNERFVKAAELLSPDDASVRLAGVFALERLAREDGANYAETVISVLAGFVRERTTRRDYPPRPKDEDPSVDEKDREPWGPPTEPVKAAVTALNRICEEIFNADDRIISADLRGAQLPHLEANVFFMRGWDLRSANLQNASLFRANLQDAILDGANLQGAWLHGADLQRARLHDADLQGAILHIADLQGAHFYRADLKDANLIFANLQDADLYAAENVTSQQLETAVWPTGAPPELPKEFIKIGFDKSVHTDDVSDKKLRPEYYDENGRYRGPPPSED